MIWSNGYEEYIYTSSWVSFITEIFQIKNFNLSNSTSDKKKFNGKFENFKWKISIKVTHNLSNCCIFHCTSDFHCKNTCILIFQEITD
jgi:hypothetical protein